MSNTAEMTMERQMAFGPGKEAVTIGPIRIVATDRPVVLDSGAELRDIPVAYRTYGMLNEEADNAILICHALTGDQYVADTHPVTGKEGWWSSIVGPGKPIDTDRYFVICSNVIGGCMGSLGPREINPETGKPYATDFPVITIADMVKVQERLVKALGIRQLHAAIGGSMGGMQVLEWARLFPNQVKKALVVASASRHSAQNIAFHEIGRQAIMADPDWCGGKYLEEGTLPVRGLAVARMTAHVTYLSEQALTHKFGRRLQDRDELSFGFDADFQVESYLRHQGKSFVQRFDPNSYLYITRAVDYFDMAAGGMLAEHFKDCEVEFCIATFSSDWLFPPSESRRIVHALSAVAARVAYVEIESDKGHDAFLLDEPEFTRTVDGFINRRK